MTWDPTQNFQNAGLIVYSDEDNYIKTGMVWNGARNFELIKETAGSPEFEGTVGAGTTPDRYFIRYVSTDGTDLESQFSADGETWTTIGTTDITGLESPRVGVYATASTQPAAGQPTANFHAVTIDPDRAECPIECPTDEFDGAELDTGKWSFLHSSTETAPFVEAGNLVLTLSEFSFDADRPGPASILGQQMPQDDWDVVAKISAPGLNEDDTGLSQFTKVGLIVCRTARPIRTSTSSPTRTTATGTTRGRPRSSRQGLRTAPRPVTGSSATGSAPRPPRRTSPVRSGSGSPGRGTRSRASTRSPTPRSTPTGHRSTPAPRRT